MKNIALLIAVIITFGFASCGEEVTEEEKRNTESKGVDLIPKNTIAVAVVSVGDIIEKANIPAIEKLDLNLVKEMLEEWDKAINALENESELAANLITNPYDVGIAVNQDMFLYAVLENIKSNENYICISGGVDSEDRLNEILKDLKDELPNDEYESGYSSSETYFDISNKNKYQLAISYKKYSYYNEYNDQEDVYYSNAIAFAWDKDKFIFITNPDTRSEESIENLEDEVDKLFDLKAKEKLTSVKSFNDFYANKTDLCGWASASGLDNDIIEDFVEEIADESRGEIELSKDDVQECSAVLYYNFGNGEVSLKTAFNLSGGVQELLKDKANIETTELSYEVKIKFDESGDNTIHVVLRSLLSIADELNANRLLREFL